MNGRLVRCGELQEARRSAMFALLRQYFDGVTPERFAADLAGKDWAVLVEDDTGTLMGFTTLAVYDSAVAPVRVICSGDTIVDRSARNSSALGRTWLEAIRQLRPDYWLLITSGFRTYRFLPVFWLEFWPRHDLPDSPPLLAALARERFGACYNPTTGIVRLDPPQRLRSGVGDLPTSRPKDPYVAFFARANPGCMDGDELACLCPLVPANQTRAGKRLLAL